MTYLECIWKDKLVAIKTGRDTFLPKVWWNRQGIVLRQTKAGLLLVKFPDIKNPVSIAPKDLMFASDLQKTFPEITF